MSSQTPPAMSQKYKIVSAMKQESAKSSNDYFKADIMPIFGEESNVDPPRDLSPSKNYKSEANIVRFDANIGTEFFNNEQEEDSGREPVDSIELKSSPLIQEKGGLCSFIVRHYRIAFGVTFAIEILPVVLTIILVMDPDYELFPIDFKGLPMYLEGDETYLRHMAFSQMLQQPEMLMPEEFKINYFSRSNVMDYLEVVYEGNNIFTRECLHAINEIEQWLTNFTSWTDDWCLTDSSGKPKLPTSLIRYFDGTISKDLYDPNFSNISHIVNTAYNRKWLQKDMKKLIHKDTVISPTETRTTLTRSIFYIGRHAVQHNDVTNFWTNHFQSKLDDVLTTGRAGMKIYYFNGSLFLKDIIAQVKEDILLAMGAGSFIVTFVLIQTQSLFITFTGIGSIITSFLWTNIIYRMVLDYRYFGIFHALSIFIILGIGADDLFVFYDMWRTTACMDLDTAQKRFTFCYRHASLSMLVTSVTTAAAFMSNMITPLYAVRTFSLFSSMLVMINYISAIAFFPMCVLLYHKDIESCSWPWKVLFNQANESEVVNKPNFIVRFFKTYFYKLVTHKIFKWILIASASSNAIMFAFLASQLDISEKDIQYYRNGFNYHDVQELRRYSFRDTVEDYRIHVHIVFGIKPNDMSQCEKYDYNCEGTFVFDNRIDMNPIPSQLAFMKLCKTLRNITGHQELSLHKENGVVFMNCFLENMNNFFKEYSTNFSTQNNELDLSIPITAKNYLPLANLRPDLYDPEVIVHKHFYRYFETAVSFWLTNAYRGDANTGSGFTKDVLLSETIGLSVQSDDLAHILSDPLSLYGTKLRYMKIELKTDLFTGSTNYKTGLKAFHAWEKMINDLMAKMPQAVQGFQVATNDEWHTFKISENLQQSSVRGIILGAIVAFFVLCISTSNIIISALATTNILLVVATFAGCIKFFGWSISIVESMNLSLVTGLSVDYVVHFSESYYQAPHETRIRKVRDMLEHMGVSVLSGAITTAGAALFMLMAKIHFFFQFGVFIVVTIMFSLFYSFFWFTPMLAMVGPEGDIGSLIPVYRWMWQTATSLLSKWETTCEEHRKLSYSRSMTQAALIFVDAVNDEQPYTGDTEIGSSKEVIEER